MDTNIIFFSIEKFQKIPCTFSPSTKTYIFFAEKGFVPPPLADMPANFLDSSPYHPPSFFEVFTFCIYKHNFS